MGKWRYHSILVRDLSIAESKLNAEGDRGWELVSVCLIDANSARCFFKMLADIGSHQGSYFALENSNWVIVM